MVRDQDLVPLAERKGPEDCVEPRGGIVHEDEVFSPRAQERGDLAGRDAEPRRIAARHPDADLRELAQEISRGLPLDLVPDRLLGLEHAARGRTHRAVVEIGDGWIQGPLGEPGTAERWDGGSLTRDRVEFQGAHYMSPLRPDLAYSPAMPFASLGLSPLVVKGVRAAGYVDPTPIQRKAIPIILEGKDLIGAAQTGTGKTAAFVLPILTRLLDGPRRLRALVLTPTRELAAQVETNARDYARFTDLSVGVVYGGVPIPPQERLLKQHGVDFLVATPGRLLDLHDRLALRLDFIETLVLDEADRMVDMGFAPDLKRILRLMPRDRQTLMFSATMPPELNRVANEALRDPARVDLAPPQRPAAGITQAVYPVPRHLKTDLLDSMLSRSEVSSVIVFARTKHGADKLARDLQRRGHSVATLHGNRSQSQRERALGDLRRGRVQVLVATDIASRGIDVEGITHAWTPWETPSR